MRAWLAVGLGAASSVPLLVGVGSSVFTTGASSTSPKIRLRIASMPSLPSLKLGRKQGLYQGYI